MNQELLDAIVNSEKNIALSELNKLHIQTKNPLEIHNSLFPVVHRVLNLPFINPHMPKMFAAFRELFPYLKHEDIIDLIRLEIMEYTVRDKLSAVPIPKILPSQVSFKHIEETIRHKDPNETAKLMAAYMKQHGIKEFTRKLLLLGSSYLIQSLGHSFSCTAIILLEMMTQKDQDTWPVLVLLSDYFCKGEFSKTLKLKKTILFKNKEDYLERAGQAVSGTGIVELHHTITLWAIERTHHLFNDHEYEHLLYMWESYMGQDKETLLREPGRVEKQPENFDSFFKLFSSLDTQPTAESLFKMLSTQKGKKQMGRFLIKALCRLYQEDYDPHFFTGLASMLWVTNHFRNQPSIVFTAIYQYVDYFFNSFRRRIE